MADPSGSASGPVTLANWQDPPFNRWAFQHVRELIPTAKIARDPHRMRRLPRAEREFGSVAFCFEGRELTVKQFLDETWTDGFIVLHEGRVIFEQYFNGMTADTPHLLMSVSKSVTSTVAGILAGRGVLDVGAPVTLIVPELTGTSFDGATVQHLLDMRAGTRFNEDYADPAADVRTYERIYLWRPPQPGIGEPGAPADAPEYFTTLENDGPHGGPFRYRSILTDVLALVIERAAGERLHELIARELWQPMGAEFDADITLDAHGNPMADCGISATLRDIARFGQLFLDQGSVGSQQIVPRWWIDDTIAGAADGAAAFVAGGNSPGYQAGSHYRNCWWVRDPGLPFYHASGINGQNVFVHGPSRTVVAKLSTWPEAWSEQLYGVTVSAALAIAQALAALAGTAADQPTPALCHLADGRKRGKGMNRFGRQSVSLTDIWPGQTCVSSPAYRGTSGGTRMNRAFNRRGLPAALTLVVAGAATLAVASGAALAATPATSHAAACAAKASTPVREGHISGVLGALPASAACRAANGANPVLRNINKAGDNAIGSPPLIWHGGAVMGTAQTGPLVITPIFWNPPGSTMAASYKSLITRYLSDVAAASGSTTNVFSIATQYTGSDGQVQYKFQLGNPINDTNALPADGCTLNHKDTSNIYADGSGYSSCLTDAQVQGQVNSVVAAQKLPVNLSHIYAVYLPKGVEACFNPGRTTNVKNACTINHQPSAAFCAYHSQAPNGLEYANMPFPIYLSATGFTCGTNVNFPGVIESPNNNPDGDTVINPTSHETNELITNPDNNGFTASGWFDVAGFENGDECNFVFGPTQGANGQFFNQVINGHHYLTQEEFSNASFFASGGGCLQSP